jgi:hypothetical protein
MNSLRLSHVISYYNYQIIPNVVNLLPVHHHHHAAPQPLPLPLTSSFPFLSSSSSSIPPSPVVPHLTFLLLIPISSASTSSSPASSDSCNTPQALQSSRMTGDTGAMSTGGRGEDCLRLEHRSTPIRPLGPTEPSPTSCHVSACYGLSEVVCLVPLIFPFSCTNIWIVTCFFGTILKQIGSLRNLRVLDLSSNRLTGPIPPELSDLSSVSVM